MRRIKTYDELMRKVLEAMPGAREFTLGEEDEVAFLLFRAPDEAALARLRLVLADPRVVSTDDGWTVFTGYAAPRRQPLRLLRPTGGD